MLTVNDLGHTQRLGSLLLSQKHLLALADLLHAHSLDSLSFVTTTGYVTVTFTGKGMTIEFTAKDPSVAFTSKDLTITFTSEGLE